MKVLLVLLALAGSAAAGIRAPDHWTALPSRAKHAEVFVPPDGAGAVELVVSTATQPVPIGSRADAARAALDDLHGIARRAALTGSNVAEDSWQEKTDATAKQAEGTLTWRDPDSHVTETARIVIAGDATQMIAVTGECIARSDAPAALVTACVTALATLDPGIAPADRVAASVAPQGTPPTDPGAGLTPNSPPRPSATMSESKHDPLPPISIPQDSPPTDRRPVFIGAGIVLIAGAFWWNMRRRARLEANAQENHDDR